MYGVVWRAVCVVLGAVGVVIAFIAVPPETLGALGLLAIVAGLTAAVGYAPGDGRAPRYGRVRVVLIVVMACGAIAPVLGLGAVLGPQVVWLLLVLGGASPPVVRWYGSRLGSAQVAEDEPACTTAELCRHWRDSYDALSEATTPIARLRIVMARQRCLDELERRDPEGMHAWLESSASPAGDPTRYVTGHDVPPMQD
jgi:hypothetical protein